MQSIPSPPGGPQSRVFEIYIVFIGSLKAGFVTERSELGSCRAFSVQYHVLKEVGALYSDGFA